MKNTVRSIREAGGNKHPFDSKPMFAHLRNLAWCLICTLTSPISSGEPSTRNPDKPASLSPPDWKDTEGKFIQAHGAGVMFHEGLYYMYGQNMDGPTKPGGCGARVDVIGVACYSSPDLVRWKNLGLVLKAQPETTSHDLHPSHILERPKVVFNQKTGKFVMWMHIDSWDYSAARAGVAVSDSPTGPFHYLASMRPNGLESRDMTLFKDDDETVYLIHSTDGNKTTAISELTDDYLMPTGRVKKVFTDRSMEAATLFKHEGKYYFIASGCTGWWPNAARSAVADSIWGPWKELGNPAMGSNCESTFSSQGTFVLPVRGGKDGFIFMADRWNLKDLGNSGYLWLPIRFEGEKPVIENPHQR